MANPKKKKGWRKIVVNERKFLWQFSPQKNESILKLRAEDSSAPTLNIILVNWLDPWINFPDAVPNEPKIITPAFVAEAILFALSNKWNPDDSKSLPNIVYKNASFQLTTLPTLQ